MVGSLTDGSTETFWESGDEDRNKTKSLTIVCAPGHHPALICVHIDNCRDLAVSFSLNYRRFLRAIFILEQSFEYNIFLWSKFR